MTRQQIAVLLAALVTLAIHGCQPVSVPGVVVPQASLRRGVPRAARRRAAVRALRAAQVGEAATLQRVLAALREAYVPVDPPPWARARLRVLHEDPPVLQLPGFWPAELCDELVRAALATGALPESPCTADGERVHGVRTSSSLVLRPHALARVGAGDLPRRLHRDLRGMLGVGGGAGLGELTGEYPQVARYERGQYFRVHEDAFPTGQALRSNYQRRLTLLVYLNDVGEGGATHFGHLGLTVRPERGAALLFFPAFADGTPDPRTAHEARPAVDEKWIAQAWAGSPPRLGGPGEGPGGAVSGARSEPAGRHSAG